MEGCWGRAGLRVIGVKLLLIFGEGDHGTAGKLERNSVPVWVGEAIWSAGESGCSGRGYVFNVFVHRSARVVVGDWHADCC